MRDARAEAARSHRVSSYSGVSLAAVGSVQRLRLAGGASEGVTVATLVLLGLIAACGVNAAVSASEKTALTDLYAATGGASWTTKTNWGTGDPCTNSWYGITCNTGSTAVS